MKKFGVLLLPYCVVIDKDNVIRWKGVSRDLNQAILDKIIANQASAEVAMAKPATNVKTPNKPIAQRASFAFNVAPADSTKRILEGNGSERFIGNHICKLSFGNIALDEVIEKISGFGAATRIKSNSETKKKQLIDVYANIGLDTLRYNNYRNTMLKNAPNENMLLSLLATALNFKIEVTAQLVSHYELCMQDDAKLKSFQSMQTNHSSVSGDNFPRFEVVGYNLKDITSFLESCSKLIITTNLSDLNRYDLSLDLTNENTLDKSLRLHGLKLKKVIDEVEFIKLTFN